MLGNAFPLPEAGKKNNGEMGKLLLLLCWANFNFLNNRCGRMLFRILLCGDETAGNGASCHLNCLSHSYYGVMSLPVTLSSGLAAARNQRRNSYPQHYGLL